MTRDGRACSPVLRARGLACEAAIAGVRSVYGPIGKRLWAASAPKARRSHGTGTLRVQSCADGRQFWYGRWYSVSRRRNRRIGLKRNRGTKQGLIKTEAEAELRRMMLRDRPPQVGEEVTFATAVELMLRELEEIDRKPSTWPTTARPLRFRLLPLFGEIPVERVKRSSVEALATGMLKEGKAAQTRASTLKLLCRSSTTPGANAGARRTHAGGVRRPQIRPSREIRFLDKEEFEAVIKAIDISQKPFGALDRAIILTGDDRNAPGRAPGAPLARH